MRKVLHSAEIPAETASGPSSTLAGALDDQSLCWSRREPPTIEDLLARWPALQGDDEGLLDLIYHEVLLRRRIGEDPSLDDYVGRFPGLDQALLQLFDVHSGIDREGAVTQADPSALPTEPVAGLSPALSGTAIPGYEIEALIGRGGMGAVYRAHQQALNRRVALKVVLAADHATPAQLARFRSEAQAVARLQHPHIVQIHEVGQFEGRPYLVLEYVDGGPLALALGGIPQPARVGARLVELLARAVQHAHERGIVHRDLKPMNILLGADGLPRIADFGLAKFLDGVGNQTDSGSLLGTPSYMAPEQAGAGSRHVGPATDIYALGAILYETLTGRPPFRAETALDTLQQVLTADVIPPSRLVPRLPRDLETICLKCLEKDPTRRYPTAAALADDLHRFLHSQPITARPVSRAERLWRWAGRKPAVAGLSAAVVVLFGLLLSGLFAGLLILRSEQVEALRHLHRAQRAEQEARDRLWEADLARARAGRWSGHPGQRFDSLRALAEAAKIRPSPELRDEVIACAALVDVCPAERMPILTPDALALVFDRTFERYARSDPQGNITVRQVVGDQEIALLPGPGQHAFDIRFSNDGRFLAAIYHQVYVLKVWDIDRARSFEVSAPTCWDFSPDGRQIACADAGGTVRVHDSGTGRVEATLGLGLGCTGLAFRPDGRQLACAVRGGSTLKFWEIEAGRLWEPEGLPRGWCGPTWHPGGRYLVGVGGSRSIQVLDTENGSVRVLDEAVEGHLSSISFSPDGRLLASTGWDSMLRLWDFATGRRLLTLPSALPFPQFRADGLRISGTRDGRFAEFWQIDGAQEFRVINEGPDTRSVAFSPDGRLLATAGAEGVRLRNSQSLERLALLPDTHASVVHFEPSGRSILTGGRLGVLRHRLEPDAEDLCAIVIGPGEALWESTEIHSLDVTPDGRTMAVADARHGWAVVMGVDGSSRKSTAVVPKLANVALSPEGRWLATGNHFEFGSGFKVWDASTGRTEWTCAEVRDSRNAFSPDGLWLVTSSADGFSCRQTGTWKPGPILPQGKASTAPGPLAFSDDGSMLALGSSLQEIFLVDPKSWRMLARLQAPIDGELTDLAFSPDGMTLAITCDRLVAVWDLFLVRRRLAALGLDWSSKPPDSRSEQVRGGSLSPKVQVVDAPWRAAAQRGDREARLGRWDRAAVALAEAIELGDPAVMTRFRLAVARLKLGDLDGYRRLCESILPERLSPNPYRDLAIGWICSLGPGSIVDPTRPARLVEDTLSRANMTGDAYGLLAKSGTLYRAGRYDEAIRCLDSLEKRKEQLPFCWLLLAMAHERRGDHAEAIRWLRRLPEVQPVLGPEWFWSLPEAAVLRREAEALILDAGFPQEPDEAFQQ